MFRVAVFIVLLAAFNGAIAQVSTPKYSNEFLAIGAGARGQGMGNTQVAIVDDVTAGYWNPAGLLNQSEKYQGFLQHGEYFSGIAKYDFLAFSTKLDSISSLGFSLIRFAIDDIPDTRFLYDANGRINYDNIRFFTAADYAFLSSYARKLNVLNGLNLGGSVKVIYRQAGDFANAWGFGIDIGAQLKVKRWQFGAAFRDATGTFTAWSHNTDLVNTIYTQTGNLIPENTLEVTVPRLILGAGYKLHIKDFSVLPALDLITTFDGARNTLISTNFLSIDPTFGLEVGYKSLAFLRFGLHNTQKIKDFDSSTSWTTEPTFGIGIHYKSVTIDYALATFGAESGSIYSHIFSLKVGIDK